MGAIGANRPLIVWDEVDDVQVAAGLPRGRVRRLVGIAGLMLRDGEDADQTPDPEVFPDRVHVSWVFRRRNEPKEGGFGYVPRGVTAAELADALALIHAVSRAETVEDRACVIASVAER
jgi:hypothetical protein